MAIYIMTPEPGKPIDPITSNRHANHSTQIELKFALYNKMELQRPARVRSSPEAAATGQDVYFLSGTYTFDTKPVRLNAVL